jgi:hypothetical protein
MGTEELLSRQLGWPRAGTLAQPQSELRRFKRCKEASRHGQDQLSAQAWNR